ncbi:hypothetical protein GCM10011608_50950 [Micromonospora sonchi]|uniref:Tetratricopeptide repeat protein n=1 Tax=Micromonospora sonchi TaxID=1763543 RepID=A0A917U6U3_9ACTN|nr:tetratricopeptide repeat protein [Micromonospora sonchi]GGM59646.1 hypothetical protein GCM10011608_50950 [Micromonospora sonchi]
MIVAILAMVVSAVVAYVTYGQSQEQQKVAVRTELGQIIQRLQALSARGSADELKDDDGNLIAYSYSGDVNAENLALAEQAAVLVEKIPGGGLPSEYLVIADAFRFSDQYIRAIDVAERGLVRAPNSTIRNGILRLLGDCYFQLGDPVEGRRQFERALKLDESEQISIKQRSQVGTRTFWAETERRAGNCTEFQDQVRMARKLIEQMPDPAYRRQAARSLDMIDVECP